MPQSLAKQDAVIVVDPYSSGRFLVYELKERGLPILCLRSSLKMGHYFLRAYDSHKEYYAVTLDFDEEFDSSVEKLVAHLGSLTYNIRAVFAGCEPGVELSERLSASLALPTANGIELLHARKDKAEMQEQLRRCGVPAADQHKSGDLDSLLSWARNRNRWPLVAKPISSSGSDGIFFCNSEDDLLAAHKAIMGAINPNGIRNTDIALQEFLSGDEYIVDTVTFDGRHECVAIWVYKKRKGLPWNATAIISEGNKLLPADGEIQDQLVSYVFQVLDAVGLRFGPCHTEVMLTSRGPILVEVNCRLHGLQGPRLIELATGTSKARAAADVMLGGELFEERYVQAPSRFLYPVQKQCQQLVLISPVEGYLTKPIQDSIAEMKLPSVVEILPAVQKGGYLTQSIDLNTSAGTLLMVHESEEQLKADIGRIRAAEDSGDLYPVSRDRLPSSPKVQPAPHPYSSPRLHSTEKVEELFGFDDLDLDPEPTSPVEMTGFDGASSGGYVR